MSARIHSFLVVLEKDTHEEDAKTTMDAIKQLRGVSDVKANEADYVSLMAVTRARQDLGEKLWQVLYPKKGA